MPLYPVKQKLQRRQRVFGTMISEFLSPELVPALAACGLDFFIIDTEHSPATYHEIQGLARACRQLGVAPLVRVTDNEYSQIARALDCGAAGIVVPRIQSAADARRALAAAKFPPLGRRGCWLRSIVNDCLPAPTPEALAAANQETIMVVQIETAEALADLENIIAVPGLDAVLVGPQDLSIALGMPGDFKNEKMKAAFRRVAEVCGPSAVAPGVHMNDAAPLAELASAGFRLLSFCSDFGLVMKALTQGLEVMRSAPARAGGD